MHMLFVFLVLLLFIRKRVKQKQNGFCNDIILIFVQIKSKGNATEYNSHYNT